VRAHRRRKKGRTRIEMADAVLGAHAEGRLRCTIGRFSDYYGPRGTNSTVLTGESAGLASRGP
jgi:nucleoside-diphosphate-sugar epimerase